MTWKRTHGVKVGQPHGLRQLAYQPRQFLAGAVRESFGKATGYYLFPVFQLAPACQPVALQDPGHFFPSLLKHLAQRSALQGGLQGVHQIF
ncbi:MAG: hypothetical protein Q4A98_00860 [Comamonadaceae bacterium]|nr:hypothetical protein [Comamonadaceae bacterium]